MTKYCEELNKLLIDTKYVLIDCTNIKNLILKDIELNELVKGNYYSIKNGRLPSSNSALDKKSYFTKKCNKVHNFRYSYDGTNFVKLQQHILITCTVHGSFNQTLDNHLQGQGCKECYGNNLRTIESFVKEANEIHTNFYIYTKSIYKNRRSKLIITCPIHGDFLQNAGLHLAGSGCPTCSISKSGWSKTDFKNHCIKNNNGLGILYVIRCFNETEEFYKIGITSLSINKRFSKVRDLPYLYEIVHEFQDDPEIIYNLETQLHKLFTPYSYKPLRPFKGSTECFRMDVKASCGMFYEPS